MPPDRDDALSWDGDDDPTLDVGAAVAAQPNEARPEPAALPDGYIAVGEDRDSVGRRDTDGTATPPGERQPLGNASLISLGVFGGMYLLYILGWVIGGRRLQGAAQFLATDIMFQGSLWLAIIAPALWYGTVVVLTRRSRPWVRLAWVSAGVLLLVPWPFIMIGAVGQ